MKHINIPVRSSHRSYTSKLLKSAVAMVLVSQLSACGKGEPIQLTDNRYLGTWVHKENAYGNDVRVDNRLLAFYEDSTVTYIRCSKRSGASTSVSLPDGYISKLSDTELVVEANLFITTAKLKFQLDRQPFQRNGDWFMQVDGVEFRKLHTDEPSDHESWPCHSEEKE